MKDYQKQNIEEALQTIAKLELLLKMCDVHLDFKITDVREPDLIIIKDKLWKKWKELK